MLSIVYAEKMLFSSSFTKKNRTTKGSYLQVLKPFMKHGNTMEVLQILLLLVQHGL